MRCNVQSPAAKHSVLYTETYLIDKTHDRRQPMTVTAFHPQRKNLAHGCSQLRLRYTQT